MNFSMCSSVAVALVLMSFSGVLAHASLTGIQEAAFDDFISSNLLAFQANLKEPRPIPNFSVQISQGATTGNGNITAAALIGLSKFNASVRTYTSVKLVDISLDFLPLEVTGNYTLDGIVDSVIIVKGRGRVNQRWEGYRWSGSAGYSVDGSGHAHLDQFVQETNVTSKNTTFEGIEGAEIIGGLIQNYLNDVGTEIYNEVDYERISLFATEIQNFLNAALMTATLEEIVGNSTLTTTATPVTGPTPSTGMTSSPGEEVIVDVGSDLANSGWSISDSSTCGYASNITGFFCQGLPVYVNGRAEGVGFWMSPCTGACTFEYLNSASAAVSKVGFNAFYNDINSECRVVVRVAHSGGSQEYVFTKGDGNSTEIGLSGYSNIQNITVALENHGSGFFSVLNTLTLTK